MKYVVYLRVSTKQQGRSGLGLEAQRELALAFAAREGAQVIAEFTEVESGGKDHRPMLAEALKLCRMARAKLLVAKLDRLSRNVGLITRLMESGVEFVCADNPRANELTIHILAAVAQEERRVTSERTKAALAARKAQGKPMGIHANPRKDALLKLMQEPARREKFSRLGKEGVQRATDERYKDIGPLCREKAEEGLSTVQIAEWLNAQGFVTMHGKSFFPMQVNRILKRFPRKESA